MSITPTKMFAFIMFIAETEISVSLYAYAISGVEDGCFLSVNAPILGKKKKKTFHKSNINCSN